MSLSTQISTLNTWANNCRIILWQLEDNLDDSTPSAYQCSQNGGIGWIAWYNRQVLGELIEAMQYFVYGHTSSFNYTYWINVHQGLYNWEHDMSLVKMIEYYINANDDARSAQRLLYDAYKASMYDKPFDQEYHNTWIQRFRSWT